MCEKRPFLKEKEVGEKGSEKRTWVCKYIKNICSDSFSKR